ncbi:hypothetical protein B0H17DRAFT_1144669 [Mycena rosella]|uniref:Uncharacterized protein n=1 Tax=Mycena rosella TaxID=1033263 RepID=A0AAD7CSX4_MYCRO|nr:hypothetical protein B0H17DRAFT_1144669 [Mycena rosella]
MPKNLPTMLAADEPSRIMRPAKEAMARAQNCGEQHRLLRAVELQVCQRLLLRFEADRRALHLSGFVYLGDVRSGYLARALRVDLQRRTNLGKLHRRSRPAWPLQLLRMLHITGEPRGLDVELAHELNGLADGPDFSWSLIARTSARRRKPLRLASQWAHRQAHRDSGAGGASKQNLGWRMRHYPVLVLDRQICYTLKTRAAAHIPVGESSSGKKGGQPWATAKTNKCHHTPRPLQATSTDTKRATQTASYPRSSTLWLTVLSILSRWAGSKEVEKALAPQAAFDGGSRREKRGKHPRAATVEPHIILLRGPGLEVPNSYAPVDSAAQHVLERSKRRRLPPLAPLSTARASFRRASALCPRRSSIAPAPFRRAPAPCSRRFQAPARLRRAPVPTPTASSNPWAFVPLNIPRWTPLLVLPFFVGFIVYWAWKAPRPGHAVLKPDGANKAKPDGPAKAPANSASSSGSAGILVSAETSGTQRRPRREGRPRPPHGPRHAQEPASVRAGRRAASYDGDRSGSRGWRALVEGVSPALRDVEKENSASKTPADSSPGG